MKIIIVPGFWDLSLEIGYAAEALKKHSERNVTVVDYTQFRHHGKIFNRKTFFALMDSYTKDNHANTTFVGFSMGAGFVYDYLGARKIKPKKLILIDPLLRQVTDVFTASYFRMLDMYKQGQMGKKFGTVPMPIIPSVPIALYQFLYNRTIDFNRKLPIKATFLWGEKDVACKITNYKEYKELFKESELIRVPDQFHNWVVYKEPVEKYFIPTILND